ncbi:type III secretion system inner rod subunit SctI [Pandoraea bronchicola]|uniref:EscI/YscI/HrpB family type III secretion system inner rod protein n=1 Tax=Pandoraea bronchicola TaxID=2508287 RepID=A0A5E5BWF2_9BURK|nr:type III secretion system inner rod subunit SctI [Pandoraea bronchicola]VVE90671.1 EscI/YscI/HrpB family type III secretion system inner rod protein [Pandoraea bronchicola]
MTTSLIFDIAAQVATDAAPAKAALSVPTASESDAVRFGHALASAPSLPEHHLLSAAGKLSGKTERLVERVALDERALDDPGRMLGVQRVLTERVLTLEVVAKAAGAATQGVNKLVHMQ